MAPFPPPEDDGITIPESGLSYAHPFPQAELNAAYFGISPASMPPPCESSLQTFNGFEMPSTSIKDLPGNPPQSGSAPVAQNIPWLFPGNGLSITDSGLILDYQKGTNLNVYESQNLSSLGCIEFKTPSQQFLDQLPPFIQYDYHDRFSIVQLSGVSAPIEKADESDSSTSGSKWLSPPMSMASPVASMAQCGDPGDILQNQISQENNLRSIFWDQNSAIQAIPHSASETEYEFGIFDIFDHVGQQQDTSTASAFFVQDFIYPGPEHDNSASNAQSEEKGTPQLSFVEPLPTPQPPLTAPAVARSAKSRKTPFLSQCHTWTASNSRSGWKGQIIESNRKIETEPELYESLQEDELEPSEEDLNPPDAENKPFVEEPKFGEDDRYSAKYVRGRGKNREAWCGMCKPGQWLELKKSAYWYDRSFRHGISAVTGKPFKPPLQLRRVSEQISSWEGLCESCNRWIAIKFHKKGNSWFRHAHECHRYEKSSSLARRRRSSTLSKSSRSSSRNLAKSPKRTLSSCLPDLASNKTHL